MAKTPEPVDRHVGNRVRMRRLMMGMSQGALAKKLGLTFQQVQKYETGANRVSASRLYQMSEILKVPVPFFFDGWLDDPKSSSNELDDFLSTFLSTSDGLALVAAFTSIKSSKLRRHLVSLVEDIAELGK